MIWLIILAIIAIASYKFLNHKPETDRLPSPNASRSMPVLPPVAVPETTTLSPRDEIAGEAESLDWVNHITNICWPHIGKIVESQLPTIEPLINQYLPAGFARFTIEKADLGKDPLKVKNVIVHRRFKNAIALDFDVEFVGSPSVRMKIFPPGIEFGIKRLIWEGRLTVLLRPLITSIPIVGAVQMAMITHPKFNMEFNGIVDAAISGPIDRAMRKVMKDVIASFMVLPNRFLFKLSETVDYFDIYYPPEGVIHVTIEKGSGFTTERKGGLIPSIPDLYCKASLGLDRMKTAVQMNNINPVWNSSKSFLVSEFEQPFELECYDKNVSKDSLVGSLKRTAKELVECGGDWMKLNFANQSVARNGKIFITTRFYSLSPLKTTTQGQCVLLILIDCARHLPSTARYSACKVIVGSEIRETLAVARDPNASEPDPSNPTWGFSCDILCDSVSHADVKLEVVDRRKVLGSYHIRADELKQANNMTRKGFFPLGGDAMIRAMVMLRGLVENDSWRIP